MGVEKIKTMFGLGLALVGSTPSEARELWSHSNDQGSSEFKLKSAFKVSGLVSAPSADPDFSNQGASTSSFLRLRLEPVYTTGLWTFDAAYDNELIFKAGSSAGISFALPLVAPTPFRLWQISNTATFGNFIETQQLDRGFASYQATGFNFTVGRQAIGWGRGTFFSAVDIFAPFTPLQIDQEWRRGVDAFRGDVKLSDTTSLEGVVAGGAGLMNRASGVVASAPSWSQSALGFRLRGFVGPIDGELLVAKRAQDLMYGLTSSAAVGGVEVHGEFALFQTPGDVPSSGIFGIKSLIPKAVLGASNNFALGNGLSVSLEYHYSGFGASAGPGISALLANPNFQNRLIQGDTQILGNQVLGLQASYTVNEQWSTSLVVLQSLIDASAVFAPSGTWEFSESASLLTTVYFAYGAPSIGGVFQSQFGEVSPTGIVQLRIYD